MPGKIHLETLHKRSWHGLPTLLGGAASGKQPHNKGAEAKNTWVTLRFATYLAEAAHGNGENHHECPRLDTLKVLSGAFVCVVDDAELPREPAISFGV